MNHEIYLKLFPFREDLRMFCEHNGGMKNNVINYMAGIMREINPSHPPINTSCQACIKSLIHDIYNIFKQYEIQIKTK